MQDNIITSIPSQDHSTTVCDDRAAALRVRTVTSTQSTPGLFENRSEIAEASKLEKQVNQLSESALGQALMIGKSLNSFRKNLLDKYGKKEGAQKYNRWVKEKLTSFWGTSAHLAKASAAIAEFYFNLDSKTRRLIRSHTKNWSLSALKELKRVPVCHLVALIKGGRQTVASINEFIKALKPKSYLTSGQPFSFEEDSSLLKRKYDLSEEALTIILDLAQEKALDREDATLLTDDIITALTVLGYDPAVVLPRPRKPSKREIEALALVEQVQREKEKARAEVEKLQQEIKQLREQLSKTMVASSDPNSEVSNDPNTQNQYTQKQLITTATPEIVAEIQVEEKVPLGKQRNGSLAESQMVMDEDQPVEILSTATSTAVESDEQHHQTVRESDILRQTTSFEQFNSGVVSQTSANFVMGQSSKITTADHFVENAIVAILNSNKDKIIGQGKMTRQSKDKNKAVVEFNGSFRLYPLDQLCILTQPQNHKKTPPTNNRKGFG